MGRALELLCQALALAGGAVLAALTLMSAVSIGGRIAGRPIQGDFELIQVGCAVAIAFFLPCGQLRRANIIVDFFTVRAPKRAQRTLACIGSLLLAIVMGLVAWRTGAGAIAMKAGGETSMIMGLPLWFGYSAMAPAFGLASAVGLYTGREPKSTLGRLMAWHGRFCPAWKAQRLLAAECLSSRTVTRGSGEASTGQR